MAAIQPDLGGIGPFARQFIRFNLCNSAMQFAENVHGRIPIYQELFMKLVIPGRYAGSLRSGDVNATSGVRP